MRLGRNLIAGLTSSAWTALIGLAVTPFYLRYLGLEAYGLIGVFTTLLAILSLLDMGLAPTMNREVARAMAVDEPQTARQLLRSLGVLYWTLAALLGASLVLAAPWVADSWLRPQSLPVEALATALMLMALVVACRWPAGLYLGALQGAQRLATASAITSAYVTAAGVGAVCILAWVTPDIHAFFLWQALVAMVYTLWLRAAAWRALGGRQRARPQLADLRRVWRFSAGMGFIAITSVVFTQVDKTMLSAMLPLDAFGRYMLATMLSGGVYVLVHPVFNTVYPRFSALVAAGDERGVRELYSLGTRLLATMVFPLAMVLGFFAEPLLVLWTGNLELAASTAPILSLLVAGTALHAVMYFPYALQLAHGLPQIPMTINTIMIGVLVPLMISLTLRYAELGAAAAWLCLHVFHLFFGTWMTHRKLLRGQARAWLARDVGVPMVLVLLVAGIAAMAGARQASAGMVQLAWGSAMLVFPAVLSLALAPQLRNLILANLGVVRAANPPSRQ